MDDCNYKERAHNSHSGCSDSSMDDVTSSAAQLRIRRFDSSMDGCNTIGPTGNISNLVFRFLYDDCNAIIEIKTEASFKVQIPLWTIVTATPGKGMA